LTDAAQFAQGHPDALALLRAETTRQNLLRSGQPHVLGAETPSLRARRKALQAIQGRDFERGLEHLDEAMEALPEIHGHLDGREFEEMRDTDDLLAGVFELLHEGNYCWVPFESILKLHLAEAETPFEEFFRPARLTFTDHRQIEVILPLLYPETAIHGYDLLMNGEVTDWREAGEGLSLGIGAHLFWIGDEEVTYRDFRFLEFRASKG
jgi:type VI secretion system protein ImpE